MIADEADARRLLLVLKMMRRCSVDSHDLQLTILSADADEHLYRRRLRLMLLPNHMRSGVSWLNLKQLLMVKEPIHRES